MPEGRLSIGNVEILALTDVEVDFPAPLRQVFPSVPSEAWASFQQRYPEAFGGPDTWRPHMGGYLLRSQGRTILVDTGIGSKATNPGAVAAWAGGVDGRMMAELQAAGVCVEDVDTVFMTHLHMDHIGWNLSREGGMPKPTFPRARYVIHKADWDTWGKPEVQAQIPFKFWEETLGPLETLGVLDLITGERSLTSEVTAIPTPGHTPGHMSLVIVSGGQRAMILGDVAVNPAQVFNSDWGFAFDMDQPLAAQTRRRFLDRAEAENTTLIQCHMPAPGFGRLVRIRGRRYWEAL